MSKNDKLDEVTRVMENQPTYTGYALAELINYTYFDNRKVVKPQAIYNEISKGNIAYVEVTVKGETKKRIAKSVAIEYLKTFSLEKPQKGILKQLGLK